MCGGGCTGGFRGNGLCTHQNPWLFVTVRITLSEKKSNGVLDCMKHVEKMLSTHSDSRLLTGLSTGVLLSQSPQLTCVPNFMCVCTTFSITAVYIITNCCLSIPVQFVTHHHFPQLRKKRPQQDQI